MNKTVMEGDIRKAQGSFVNGTNDSEAYPKHWIAALVHTNCERKSADKLSKLGITNYLPVQNEIRQWSDRRKKITRVVIPMIIFVHVDETELKIVRNLSFIHKLVTFPGQKQPAIIPDNQISQLQFMVNNSNDEVSIKDSSLNVGDKVKVIRGVLKGLEGQICFLEENKPQIAIRLDILGYACVNIPTTDIEQLK